MHLLASTSATIEDLAEPIDLRQPPGDVLALSFTDSDLLALAAAWRQRRDRLPSLRLARLKDLRHPMSVDLWIDKAARHAKVILVRQLGGLDWWRYGAERLAELARTRGIALALLPGEDQDDPRLAALSTVPAAELAAWLGYFRQGGPDNMAALLERVARVVRGEDGTAIAGPKPVPPASFYLPGLGAVDLADVVGRAPHDIAPPPHSPAPLPPPQPSPASGRGGAVAFGEDERSHPDLANPLSRLRGRVREGEEGLDVEPQSAGSGAQAEAWTGTAPHDLAPLPPRSLAPSPPPQPSPASGRGGAVALGEGERSHPDLANPLSRLRGRVREGEEDRGRAREGEEGINPAADRAGAHAPPRALLLFYRSMWLAGDLAPIDDLCAAFEARGIAPVPLFLTSLKDPKSRVFVRDAIADTAPDLILTATAFAAGDAEDIFPAGGPPVLQIIPATTARDAWANSPRGLAAADLAMHVVLPELDGRVLAGAISFKDMAAPDADLAFTAALNSAEPQAIAHVAERAAALIRLARTPRAERRISILMPDYPGAPGRTGYAVGLDVPESVRQLLETLEHEGYDAGAAPADSKTLLAHIVPSEALPLADYRRLFAALPSPVRAAITAAWRAPEDDRDVQGDAFHFRFARFGHVTVALAPDRGASLDRRADYHDPALPPRHALLAFGLWLRHGLDAHALVHMGAHGTLEWLPGKAVALTQDCFPQAVLGPLPVIYPFIVSNPGEAAQAKRRIAAVTLGHLPPPLTGAGLTAAEQTLERLVDEYAEADGLDPRRRDRLARLIVESAGETGLSVRAGVDAATDPNEALRRIDAWLCDVKDMQVKDGLHIYGAADGDAARMPSADAERAALLAALDGRHVSAGPAGAPARGRRDVLPTGRNLFTADPRHLPTPTALDLGRRAADEVVRAYLQEHGDYPRAVVIDLWGSATLRTGGEEIAQGLHLMGCWPIWDPASGRVTGIEVLPPASMGRPRVDVSWRVSGLFRDIFPAQLALLDAAARAVAARAEEADENPLAALARAGADVARIFGSAPGAYGAGIEDALARGAFADRGELGAAYLAAASHVYDGPEGAARPAAGAFAAQVARADALLHTADDPARDLLDGAEDGAFMGGFAAAAALLGKAVDLVVLDTSDPEKPKARPLKDALTRIVHGRVSAAFIAGQMRHGPRGAAELTETVDRLVAFAETTHQVASHLLDQLHAAYLADEDVRAFLLRENPQAADAMARRFEDARRRGLWHARRNDLDGDLAALRAEARDREKSGAEARDEGRFSAETREVATGRAEARDGETRGADAHDRADLPAALGTEAAE